MGTTCGLPRSSIVASLATFIEFRNCKSLSYSLSIAVDEDMSEIERQSIKALKINYVLDGSAML